MKAKKPLAIPNLWKKLVRIPDIETLHAKLIEHFSILADTNECQKILSDIVKKVDKVEIVDGRLVLSILASSGVIGELVCSAPETKFSKKFPKSYIDILKLHGSYSFPGFGRKAYESDLGHYAAVFLGGGTMFEPSTSEEKELIVVIDTHRDWFVLDPSITLSIEKPAVSFLSHGSAKIENISRRYSIGGHYLRLIALTILGDKDTRLKELRSRS